jgi:glycolate oxidase FAD binding subunit
VRLGGLAAAFPDRLTRLGALTGGGDILMDAEDAACWRAAREWRWLPEDAALVKVPVTPGRIVRLETDLTELILRTVHLPPNPLPAREGAPNSPLTWQERGQGERFSSPRRYSAGGQVAWIAWPPAGLDDLDTALKTLDLSGLVVLGQPGRARLGARTGQSFERRVKAALDPEARFVEV